MSDLSLLIASLDKPLHALSEQERANANDLFNDLISEGKLHHSIAWAAHMSPAIDAPALLGQLLAGLHNGNLLSAELYPHLSKIEQQLMAWLCPLFKQKHGHFTHGSSYSNLEALWQAREHSLNGSTIVYGSEASHYSIAKACRILGLSFNSIATNEQGEISVEALTHACQQQQPIAIVATAGTSSCGAIDNITSCVALAQQYSSWCHIDAAWGGALMLTQHAYLLDGLAEADSISFDPHKALGQPKPCGVLLYQLPLEQFADIDYLMHAPKQTLAGSYGGELFLPLWCSLLLTGESTMVKHINSRLQQAEYFYTALQERTNWWLLFSPTGIVCFRPPQHCDLSALIRQGMLSQAIINEQPIYRVIFASHTTQFKALLTALEAYC